MADIFISYRREDEGIARRLAELLEAAGFSVWWDRDIPPGFAFDNRIRQELESSSTTIVLWSERSVDSQWVRDEASSAAQRGTLLPVLVEQVELPAGFRQVQAADLTGWSGEPDSPAFSGLLRAVE